MAAYGWPPGFALTFERFWGLSLNVGRQYARGCWQHADGAALGRAGDTPALEWFEALSGSEAEAKARHARAMREHQDRAMKRLMAMPLSALRGF